MITKELSDLIGKTEAPIIMIVEKGAIKKIADAVDDTNPLYWDEEYARSSRFGSIIAPPGFFGWAVKPARPMPTRIPLLADLMAAMAKSGFPGILDGETIFEFILPIRAGDTLTAVHRISALNEREGKSGKMIFATLQTTYTNNNSDLVAKVLWTIIGR